MKVVGGVLLALWRHSLSPRPNGKSLMTQLAVCRADVIEWQ